MSFCWLMHRNSVKLQSDLLQVMLKILDWLTETQKTAIWWLLLPVSPVNFV